MRRLWSSRYENPSRDNARFFFFLKNKEQKQLDGIKGEEDDVVGTYGRDEK